MAENLSSLTVIGIIAIVLITAGLTYYIAKASELTAPIVNITNETEEPAVITVRGEATRTVAPDLLTIGLTVESFGNTTADSQAQSSKDVAKVKAALLAAGLKESEIQTSSYYTYEVYDESCYYDCYPYYYDDVVYGAEASGASLKEADYAVGATGSGVAYPDYYPPVPPRPYPCKTDCNITGYKTVHTLALKAEKVNDGGEFIDAALGAVNTSRVEYIYFSLKDETRVRHESELQALAAQSAKEKAENIATGLGAKLGRIVSVNPDYIYPPYPVYAYDRASSPEGSVPTEIFPSDTTMSSSMMVVYELEQ